jgi:hypothetical protein
MSTVRWSIVVPEATDRALRTFLAERGMGEGDLSRFVDDAVRAHLFHLSVEEIKDRHHDRDQGHIMASVDGELRNERN